MSEITRAQRTEIPAIFIPGGGLNIQKTESDIQ
jgi:hypothetical protein